MNLFLKSFISIISILFFSACSSIWNFQNDGLNTSDNELVVVEQMEGRWSPKIKIFKHIDLNIYKESAGNPYNDAYAVKRIETPPGKIELVIVLNWGSFRTHSFVKLNAESGHKYLLTWICIPYPFIAIVDEKSSRIVALDSGCPNCDWLIGTKISEDTVCLYERTIPRPSWGKVNLEEFRWEYNPPFDEEKMRLFSNSPHDKDRRLQVQPQNIP